MLPMVLQTVFCHQHLNGENRNTYNKVTIFAKIPYWKRNARYGGHQGVTRSLVQGLRKINMTINYNPSSLVDLGDVVVVLADIDILELAIQLKRDGRIKKLLAGPNLMARADEFNGILQSPEIDVIITPSDWVKTAYEEELPAIKGRIQCWYAGINTDYWSPSIHSTQKNKNMLIYRKTTSEEFTQEVENTVKRYGWNAIRISYGEYNQKEYKLLLERCSCALFLSISESQGLALAEAWAMDVPTLVWNNKQLIAHGRFLQ